MGLILRFVFAALIGFASHIFWRPSRNFGAKHGQRWGAKIRHAIGILTLAVPLAYVREALLIEGEKNRTIAAMLLTGLCYGGGDLLGHFLDD